MIRIGEKLNSSIPSTLAAMRARDAGAVAELARSQKDAGAEYLDVNTALLLGEEAETLAWAVREVQRACGARVMIDSTNPEAVAAALKADTVGGAAVNSVNCDPVRLDTIAPLLREYDASVVALAMGPEGVPPTPEGRLEAVERALEGLAARGIPIARVFADPLVEALSSHHCAAATTLETIRLIRRKYPELHIVCGVSNVSFGLPARKKLNAAFLTAAVCAGADAAIFDVCDPGMRQAVAAAEAVAGKDEYCMGYIGFYRDFTK
jgi:cobalamin-dependent methionine synthase I